MKHLLLLIIFIFSFNLNAKTLRIAVIDTGIDKDYIGKAHLCKTGHKSFTPDRTIYDRIGHGTNVIGLIVKYAKNVDYCIIVIKFYGLLNFDTTQSMIKSIKYARKIRADIVNISAGGTNPVREERLAVKALLKDKIILNAAAGNEMSNLDLYCGYYPACYNSKINVIGAKGTARSNYGKRVIDYWVYGKDQVAFGYKYTGTSQATAIFTGIMIRAMQTKLK